MMQCHGKGRSFAFHGRMEILWKEFFRDPSLWHDNRSLKNSNKSPDFRQKFTCEPLWIDGWYNPFWVCEELRRRTMVLPIDSNTETNHGEGVAFVALLKACAREKDLCKGTRLHDEILSKGLLEKTPYLPSSLINMYAKCGVMLKAHQVLEGLAIRDVISWNALIGGYVQCKQGHEALNCFERMKSERLSPNSVTFMSVLKACSLVADIDKGKQIHNDVMMNNSLLENNLLLGNALVDMYAKCGMLTRAQQVLEELPVRDVVSWNALITGYAREAQVHEALDCLEQMQRECLSPNAITFICILKACGSARAVDKGKQIHNEITSMGLLEKDIVLGCALVDMYAKCSLLSKAREVLEELPMRDAVSWSALISGYAEDGQVDEALNCFEQMQNEGLYPDLVTFLCILKACSRMGSTDKGKKIHDELKARGLLFEKDIMLGTALVDMYAKCGLLAKARQVLEELPVRNIVSWSALIVGYVQQEQAHEALNCFERMLREGLSPNAVTFSCLLKACSSIGAIEKGEEIHRRIVRMGLLKKDIVLGTALVDMYAKCGMLAKAHQVLGELPDRSIATWNALIAGHAQEGQCDEALNCLEKMQDEGISPNVVTFICILKSCGSAGAIDKGQKIHEEIVKNGLIEKDIGLGNALINMYAKCSMPIGAQKVLEELPIRDIIGWNAVIAGYAQQGQSREALNCLGRMQSEGLTPDEVTFLCILSACIRSGLLDNAEMFFESMNEDHGISPNLEHHNCMVVGFGCAGQFDKAMSVIKSIESLEYYPAVWLALLGACRKWGNVKLGTLAFDQVLQLRDTCAAAYVLMANIFAAAGMQKDAVKVEAMRIKYTNSKEQDNTSWATATGHVRSFSVGDIKHPQCIENYRQVGAIALGISQEGNWSENVVDDGKMEMHSEKLPIAYSLINTPQGETVHLVDNMCVCRDCHVFISVVSKIEDQKIMVRDHNRLHIFENGKSVFAVNV